MSKLSHADVVILGYSNGLTWHAAEEIAFELCPEYSMTTLAKAERAIKKAVKK